MIRILPREDSFTCAIGPTMFSDAARKSQSAIGAIQMTWNTLSNNPGQPAGDHGMIGASPLLASIMEQIAVVAPTGSTVLIQGETGTGKELVAQAIHNLSPRRNAPLVKVNCAAIPAGLLESELFGHERGAFTGALTQRIGRFEMANGSTRTTRVNVRVVAATHRDLTQMVADKEFRADLFYRLSVFPVSLPPLRDRRDDIPLLVRHFIALYAERMNRVIDVVPSETMDQIVAYDWPGNVRQLQNFVEHGVIVTKGQIFQPALSQLHSDKAVSQNGKIASTKTLEDATRDHVLQTLEDTQWVVGGRHGAAARLGIARTTLIAKMRRLGLEARDGSSRGANHQAAFGALA